MSLADLFCDIYECKPVLTLAKGLRVSFLVTKATYPRI